MAELNCTSDISNISRLNCGVNYGFVWAYGLIPVKSEIATSTAALLQATWTTLLNLAKTDRMFFLSDPHAVEPTTDDPVFKEYNTRKREQTQAGNIRDKFTFANLPRCKADALKTLNGKTMYAYEFTDKGFIIAGSSDGTKITPCEVEISVNNERRAAGVEELWEMDVFIDFIDPDETAKKAIAPHLQTTGAWQIKDLDGILDVEITINTTLTNATTLVVDLTALCDGREVTADFLATDFVVTNVASGTAVVPTLITRSGNTYTISVAQPAGTWQVKLKDQPDNSINGYESANYSYASGTTTTSTTTTSTTTTA
jgi:hypothetical protein